MLERGHVDSDDVVVKRSRTGERRRLLAIQNREVVTLPTSEHSFIATLSGPSSRTSWPGNASVVLRVHQLWPPSVGGTDNPQLRWWVLARPVNERFAPCCWMSSTDLSPGAACGRTTAPKTTIGTSGSASRRARILMSGSSQRYLFEEDFTERVQWVARSARCSSGLLRCSHIRDILGPFAVGYRRFPQPLWVTSKFGHLVLHITLQTRDCHRVSF